MISLNKLFKVAVVAMVVMFALVHAPTAEAVCTDFVKSCRASTSAVKIDTTVTRDLSNNEVVVISAIDTEDGFSGSCTIPSRTCTSVLVCTLGGNWGGVTASYNPTVGTYGTVTYSNAATCQPI